jgi:uncharacterized protein YfaS (alpha-2-macroglobulin family)
MKKAALLILLFSTLSHAQQPTNNYSKLWKEVEQFDTDELPKSANKIVNKIYELAKKEKNTSQLVKSLFYQSKYALILEEDAQLKIVHNFEKEIKVADFPAKNILESVLANLYWQYFQQNRWRFYNRTQTDKKVDPSDFRTWDLQTLFKEVHQHFEKSLENGLLAQTTPLSKFDEILNLEEGSKEYRPSLYDFLAHNALAFYKTDETHLTKPAYKFEIDNKDFLAVEKYFAELKIVSKDTFSLQQKALQLFQKLIQFHRKQQNINALVVVDLERLHFVRQLAKFDDKDAIYIKTLSDSKLEYKSYPISTLYDYEIALYYKQQGQKYHPNTASSYQWEIQKAKQVCEEAIEVYPKSLGAQKCKALLATIIKPSLQFKAEQFIPANEPSRILVHHKNTNRLFLKVLKIDNNKLRKLYDEYNDKTILNILNGLEVVDKWQAKIKNESDYQQHQSELVIPKLSQGKYIIFASDFDTDIKTYAYTLIQVTDVALLETNTQKQQIFQVVDRMTGAPYKGAKVHLSNPKSGRYSAKINKNFTTDKFGQIYLPKNDYYYNVEAVVTYKDKRGEFDNFYLQKSYRNNRQQRDYNQAFLFTDRSIYRPGQTVFFKAIVVTRKPRGNRTFSEVLPSESVSVQLTDVNGQKVGELDLETNDFGSVSGEFILPDGGLTGNFHLRLNGENKTINGNVVIAVEEYKRPKFETEFKPVTESYKINDTITAIGTATAFAGNAITEAKVVYRVHRKIQYPRWWYWYRPNFSSEPQEITHGETFTDAEGNYKISFIAQPDKSVNKKDLPIFHYEITADVTDINGETHSTTSVVNIGYHSATAQINTQSDWDKNDKEQKIGLVTKNLNHQDVSLSGTIKIYKLKAPDQVLRVRPWGIPDYKNMTEQEFHRLFPHDAYAGENSVEQWSLGTEVYSESFVTEIDKENEILLKRKASFKKWTPGKYQIVLETKDKFGQTITDKQLFTLYDTNADKVSDRQLIVIRADQDTYKAGENVCLQVGSASNDISVLVTVEKDKKIVNTFLVSLNDEIKYLEIPVLNSDLGGFAIHYTLVNYNAFVSGAVHIQVPFEQKDLEIETLTFRDKLQPGSEQTWSFKLKGLQKDKVAAEFLASMYDASLDQFQSHKWHLPSESGVRPYYSVTRSNAGHSFATTGFRVRSLYNEQTIYPKNLSFDRLNWFGFSLNNYYEDDMIVYSMSPRGALRKKGVKRALEGKTAGILMEEADEVVPAPEAMAASDSPVVNDKGSGVSEQEEKTDFSGVQVRTNFNETAFFYPQLQTDEKGAISFTFTIPEALTRWKLQLLGHTKDVQTAYRSLTTFTQKNLMLLPNPPRFLREGDKLIFSTKISNLTDNSLKGNVRLELTNPFSGKEIKGLLTTQNGTKPFEVTANGNTVVFWELIIPDALRAVQYKIIAKAGDFSDGEQNVLPVLTNRMLVTESMPMWVNSNESKTFTLNKLKETKSTTLRNHKLTLEVTSNPVWYAVQALPYLMEYPYECSEQTFSRYYANAIATKIVQSNPRIKLVFDQWSSGDALLSNLEKNQELKSLLIQETPWLRDAQSEAEQKKRIALLFDLNKMANELKKAENKLADMQMNDGGFPWFKGGRYPSRYITQHIATGFGHLKKLDIDFYGNTTKTSQIIDKAIQFLDNQLLDDYNELLRQAKRIKERASNKAKGEKLAQEYLAANHLGNIQLQYLYMRSFYDRHSIKNRLQTAVTYYTQQAYTYWTDYALYQKALIALVAHRNDTDGIAQAIIKSLEENSITGEEMGMYWKENQPSWYWYQAPIETQALLIETFAEINNNPKTIDNLKKWLLKNKQTNRWKTTKATTEAVYALLGYGNDWTENQELVEVKIGSETLDPLKTDAVKIEAGTGYFKTSWNGTLIKPEQAEVTLTKKGEGIAWGALYWQYFENLDKISFAKTPLQITKKLFLKKNTDTGEKLTEITPDVSVKVGDLVRVRIELKVDRAMEFVHMKDMRASGLEPINVLSRYKYQDGLGYYESTKDASTNFFFDNLRKGVYVFEYDLRANNAGDFSNGITSIQCMYAPEFTSHSEGVRIKID